MVWRLKIIIDATKSVFGKPEPFTTAFEAFQTKTKAKMAKCFNTTGFENMADDNNDVQYKAYDHTENIEFHMQEYLSWEIGLVDLIERDGTARFRHVPR